MLFRQIGLALITALCFTALADEPGTPVNKLVEGKYTIGRNTFLIDNSFRLFNWQDGKTYIEGKLNYSSYRISYQLPLTQASDAAGNHFTAVGKGTSSGCQYDLQFDLYAYEGKVFLGVYGPDTAECGTTAYTWERFEQPFVLYTPPPPPVKPTCACKEVVTVDYQLLCTLEGVSHALSGACTPQTCASLIKEAAGNCIAP